MLCCCVLLRLRQRLCFACLYLFGAEEGGQEKDKGGEAKAKEACSTLTIMASSTEARCSEEEKR